MAGDWAALTRQVKEANDIVAVVGSYLPLKPSGPTSKGLCPFHNDSRPSLDVDPRRQRYRCWACGKFGDVFTFIQEMEKVDFGQAREMLARRAGINLEDTPRNDARVRLLEVIHWAARQYQDCLLESPAAEGARVYLGERKLSGATVRNFGLGFAPIQGDWLVDLARKSGQPEQTLVDVGLIAPRNEGKGFYDRFRDRVMFPIRNVRGQIVGFGGRILPNSPLLPRAPKYYNSSDTPLFQKKELLYGLDVAKQHATVGYLAVVEGYTDVMMAHQLGVPQVVATMGTALNAAHVQQLGRFVNRVVLVFDADAGGLTGVDRALEIFVTHDIELAIASLPEGLDPCDLLVERGAEAFTAVLSSAVDALDFKLNRLLARPDAEGPAGQKRVVDSILGIMALAPDVPGAAVRVKQELLVTRLAHRMGLSQKTLWERFGELRVRRKKEDVRPAADRTETTPTRTTAPPVSEPHLERQLLTMLLTEPAFVPDATHQVRPEELSHAGLRRLIDGLYQLHDSGQTPDIDGLRGLVFDPALISRALELQSVGREVSERPKWFKEILARFRDRRSAEGTRKIREQLTATADQEAAVELLRRLQNPTEGSGS